MKGIKTILGVLAVAGLLGFSFSASAQENGNRDENGNVVRGPYETNNFGDNWFIGIGGGANGWISDVKEFDLSGLGIAVDGFVGKWFTPSVGARVGYKGLSNGTGGDFSNTFDQHFIHADAMWNISNALGGYKETRFWDVIPYAGFGGLYVDKTKGDWEYGATVGILNDFRLGNHVDLFLDLNAIAAYGRQYQAPRKVTVPLSATVGLLFNLGKTNFDRHSSVTPVVIPVPFTTEQYNALKNRVAQLEKENADLKSEIEALKKATPDTVYVNKPSEIVSESTTFFDLGSAALSVREKAHLDFFIENVIKTAPADKVFEIVGSADSKTGSVAGNQKLSEHRANAVKDYLVKNGVDAGKLTVKALGGIDNYKPIANNRVVTIR